MVRYNAVQKSEPDKSRTEEAIDAAEDLIKDLLRDQSVLPFHCQKVSDHYAPDRIKRFWGWTKWELTRSSGCLRWREPGQQKWYRA